MSSANDQVLPDNRILRGIFRFENGLNSIVLLLIAVLPTMEIVARIAFKTGIHSSADMTHHLVLWLTCLGGAITSREGKHITLSAGLEMMGKTTRSWISTVTLFISTTISSAMTWSALSWKVNKNKTIRRFCKSC